MAAFTSQRTGNWSDTSTSSPWYVSGGTPCAIPGDGDTATVAAGHTVTVDVDTTVGSSPADQTTIVVQVTSSGANYAKLVIAAGVTLTVKGNISVNAGVSVSAIKNGIEWGAGSVLKWPVHNVSGGWVLKTNRWTILYARGVNGNTAKLQTAAGSTTNGCVITGDTWGPSWDAQYIDFTNLGSASISGIAGSIPVVESGGGSDTFLFSYCNFTSCGKLNLAAGAGGPSTTAQLIIDHCTFNTMLTSTNTVTIASVGSACQFTNNMLDRSTSALLTAWNMTVEDNYFGGNFNANVTSGNNDKRAVSFKRNFVRMTTSANNISCSQDSNYVVLDNDNANQVAFYSVSKGGSNVAQNGVLEHTLYTSGGSTGDMIQFNSDGTTATISGTASGTGGVVRITTSSAHNFNVNDRVVVAAVQGTTEANNATISSPYWTISAVPSSTTFEIPVTFANAYVSGSFQYAYRVGLYVTISGCANNGSGLIRVTHAATTPAGAMSPSDTVTISGVTGTTEANGTWTINVIDATHFDLVGSTFANAYVSGGSAMRNSTGGTLKGWLYLANAYGYAVSKFVSLWGSNAFYNIAIEHNTYPGVFTSTNTSEAGLGVGESAVGMPGMISSFKSNLVYCPPTSSPPSGMVADANAVSGPMYLRWQTSIQDHVSAANADYNWGYNLATENSLYGYYRVSGYRTNSLFSTGTPDAHGANGNSTFQQNPQFIDMSRNLATYDTAKLGTTAAQGTWTTSTSYAEGDVVSLAQSGYYFGATINFRCIVAHTSGASTKPGTGGSWRTNWEFNSLAQLRSDMTRIVDLWTWVRAGFKVQNSAMNGAGHDGVTPGAMGYQGGMMFFLRRLTGGFVEMG